MKEYRIIVSLKVDANGKETFTPDKQFKGETWAGDSHHASLCYSQMQAVKVVQGTNALLGLKCSANRYYFQGGDPLVPIDIVLNDI